jgi:glycosyltransferase involved in cell wall biosynthesis
MSFDEIIVINDGSTIKYTSFVEKLLKNYPKIIYLKHDSNRGISSAKNTGIIASKSDWIICNDDDNYFFKDVVSDLKQFIENHPKSDIIYYKEKVISEIREGTYGVESFNLEDIKNCNCIPHCSAFKKSVWKNLNGFRNIPFEDWDFWIRAKQLNLTFTFYSDIFYIKENRLNDRHNQLLYRDLDMITIEQWKKRYISND